MNTPEAVIFDFFHNKQSVESEPYYVLVGIIKDRDDEWSSMIGSVNMELETVKKQNKATMRQRYAMAALTGLLSDPIYRNPVSDPHARFLNKMMTIDAFRIADAMIAQEAKE